ncbi:hypothetical protein E4T48_05841 [Aureobasidium sp. EXF-10727]|nr:hypothetical protein E4T48_05841 [Aureobasidium sp. EXF-10727]
MKYNIALAALATAAAASEHPLLTRQTDNTADYTREVCFPNTTSPVPPCQAIINIESACQPNGTSPLAYQAHQQCMCNGGYFPNWSGCLNCNYVHGLRSEAVAKANENIISSASSQFCGAATPTAVFASYFAAVSDASPQTASGATTVSDQFPSQSAVSLYYTATGNQGPGAITGSAAQATAVASSSAASGSSSGSLAAGAATSAASTTSRVSSSGSSSSARSSSSSTHSSTSASQTGSSSAASSSAAAHTGAASAVVVSEGLLAVVAGAMMFM